MVKQCYLTETQYSTFLSVKKQSHKENADQVAELLDIIAGKTNNDYESFCDALQAAGHGGVVRNLLFTPGIFIYQNNTVYN